MYVFNTPETGRLTMKTLIILTRNEEKSIKDEFTSTWGQNSKDFVPIDAGKNKILLIRRYPGKTLQNIADDIKTNLSSETDRIGVLYHQPLDIDINNFVSANYLDKYDFISIYGSNLNQLVSQLAQDKSEINFENVWNSFNRKSPINLTLDILNFALCKDGAKDVKRNSENYPIIYSNETDALILTLIRGDDALYIHNYNNLRNHLFEALCKMQYL